MTRPMTPAERLAAADKDLLLAEIAQRSTWDRFLVEQAVFTFGLTHETFDCNSLRDVLPELGHGFLGAAISSLRAGGVIEHTGRTVPSTQPSTRGHRIGVWQLTAEGRRIAAQRRATRSQQGRAA